MTHPASLMHPEPVADLAADLESAGHPRRDADIDRAIQSAVESWMDREGTRTPPTVAAGTPLWDELIEPILASLDLDIDEVFEVAP